MLDDRQTTRFDAAEVPPADSPNDIPFLPDTTAWYVAYPGQPSRFVCTWGRPAVDPELDGSLESKLSLLGS